MALELKKTDAAGKPVGTITLEEDALGGKIKNRLMHAAAVMYHANLRQGSHSTKTRAEIAGSSKKMYRQKGTGRARAGNRKSGTRRGGGVIHGPKPRDYSYSMPKKQREAALRSAVLTKAKDGELHVVAGLTFDAPKTKALDKLLSDHGIAHDTALVATDGLQREVFLSGRNIPGVTVKPGAELNARDVLTHKHLVIDERAFERFTTKPERVGRARKPKGTRKQKTDAAGAGKEG